MIEFISLRVWTLIKPVIHKNVKFVSFKDITIVTVGKNGYRINFWGTTESEAVNRMENADLNKKGKQLWVSKKYIYYSDVK